MKKLIVEFIGTFFLVLTVALTGEPIAIGFMLVALVYMGGAISGAHYNPAVTVGLLTSGKIVVKDAAKYIVAQMAGGMAASLVYIFFKEDIFIPGPSEGISMPVAMLVEALFAFLLVTVVHHVAVSEKSKGNQYFGLAIGLALLTAAYAGGPLSGGAYNPAVGVAPLLIDFSYLSVHVQSLLLYSIGPLVGGVLAGWVYKNVYE